MRTVTREPITVYTFEELSSEAQKRACRDFAEAQSMDPYTDDNQYKESLTLFCELFGIDPKNVTYNIDTCSSNAGYRGGHTELEYDLCRHFNWLDYYGTEKPPEGVRLWKWLKNQGIYDQCKDWGLTGCWTDEICKPLEKFIDKPNKYETLAGLFTSCIENWAYTWQQDLEYVCSEENAREVLEGSDYEFREDGTLFCH